MDDLKTMTEGSLVQLAFTQGTMWAGHRTVSVDDIVAEVVRRTSESKPKLDPDQIMLADGRVVKVTGTLWVSEDGYVVGHGAAVSTVEQSTLGPKTLFVGVTQAVAILGECDDFSSEQGPPRVWAKHENAVMAWEAAEAARAKEGK